MTDLKEVIVEGEQQKNADLVIEVEDVEQENVLASKHLEIGAGLLNAAPFSPAPRGDASAASLRIGTDGSPSSPMKSTDGGSPGLRLGSMSLTDAVKIKQLAKSAKKDPAKKDGESSDESEEKRENQLSFEEYKAMREEKKKLMQVYNSP